jgi:hypothetical protein
MVVTIAGQGVRAIPGNGSSAALHMSPRTSLGASCVSRVEPLPGPIADAVQMDERRPVRRGSSVAGTAEAPAKAPLRSIWLIG